MDFITSYKRLEKLCGDLYGNNRGISSYIEEMKTLPGYRHVSDWNEDLKQLKHYRQIRNQIVHEPDHSGRSVQTYLFRTFRSIPKCIKNRLHMDRIFNYCDFPCSGFQTSIS